MNNQSLLLSQRNDVFSVLQQSEAAPFIYLLEWKFTDEWSTLFCRHQEYQYKFTFRKQRDRYGLYYFPNQSFCDVSIEPVTWDKALHHLPIWAKCIAYQLRQPDYWESARSLATSLFASTSYTAEGSRKFSEPEAGRLRQLLAEYRQQLVTRYTLSPEQASEIDQKLDYLAAQIDAQTRQAWLNTAIGVIVSIAAIIRPEAAVLAGVLSLFGSLLAAYRRPQLSNKGQP